MADGHINPANVPDIALRDGHSIPQVGLGVLRIDALDGPTRAGHDSLTFTYA